jgi:hypothetical protein
MRRVLIAVASCAAVLAFGVADASATSAAVYKCEADATWQVTLNLSGSSYADVTYDTGGNTGCRRLNATVESDGNFDVSLSDFGFAATSRWNLTGVGVTGVPGTFAGAAMNASGGTGAGTVVIANGNTLNAEVVFAKLNGDQQVVEVTGTSSCGTNCYRTHMVWEGTPPPTA